MFKILTLGILFYLLYSLVLKPKMIEPGEKKAQIRNDSKRGTDDGEYVDYEEVE